MTHIVNESTFEYQYFVQKEIANLVDFKHKYFYEGYENAKAWMDYWNFFIRLMNYYVSVVSYFFLGIFTCSAHEFEQKMQSDVFTQLKVAYKQNEQIFPNPKFNFLNNNAIARVWSMVIKNEDVEFFKFIMKALPTVDLNQLEDLELNFFKNHCHHPEIHEYLETQRINYTDVDPIKSDKLNALFDYIKMWDTSHQDELRAINQLDKERLSALQDNLDKEFVENAVEHDVDPACFQEKHLDILVNQYLKSSTIREYLERHFQDIRFTEGHYQTFSNLFFQNEYTPTLADLNIFRTLSIVATHHDAYLERAAELEHRFVDVRRERLLKVKPNERLENDVETIHAFQIILAVKKSNSKNKEWDELLKNLSQNQSLTARLSEQEQHDLSEIYKSRPLGGAVGHRLKELKKNGLFSTSMSKIEVPDPTLAANTSMQFQKS